MAGRKKKETYVHVNDEKEFEDIIQTNANELICAEVYSYAFGYCTALDRLFVIIKMNWSDGKIVLLRVPADEIESLKRFRNQSEPVYIFILNMKVTKVFRGVDMVGFGEVVKRELQYYRDEEAGLEVNRLLYELDEVTPDEQEWMAASALEKEQASNSSAAIRKARQAARKQHRAELMIPHLTDLNFILYWPHCLHAHPELYERWDANNIVMVARELIQISEEMVADIFYAGDAPLNEASLHKLRSGPALALCLRLVATDECFVTLVRRIMYEELKEEPHDPKKPIESQSSGAIRMITAYNYYLTMSPTREEIIRQQRAEKEKRKGVEKERRARKLSVMQRLARQAIEEALEEKRKARELRKLNLLKAGDLEGLAKFKAEPEDDEVDIVVPEAIEEDDSTSEEEEDPNEYCPPAGLLIPGFYAPPNDIAKVNGLAILFPKLVLERVQPLPETLPPHILVMLEISKRHKAIEAIRPYKRAVIHMGIFVASSPYDSVHIAYTVKQFESLDKDSLNLEDLKIAFMMSIESDIAMLQLVDLNPFHVSRDAKIGEEECAAMFSVDYCDDYDQFEDFSN